MLKGNFSYLLYCSKLRITLLNNHNKSCTLTYMDGYAVVTAVKTKDLMVLAYMNISIFDLREREGDAGLTVCDHVQFDAPAVV